MSNLTPVEIARWFRSQAQVFNEMAATIERTFSNGAPVPSKDTLPRFEGPPDSAALRQALSEKARRTTDLADQFSIPRADMEKLLAHPESGIEHAGRGWWKLKT